MADNNKEPDKPRRCDGRPSKKAAASQRSNGFAPEFDHGSAAYLTACWVLFKKKKFADAKKELLEATKDKDDGQHIEILDHLADVHMALGEKAEAVAVWKKALAQEATTTRDKDRKKVIENKMKEAAK